MKTDGQLNPVIKDKSGLTLDGIKRQQAAIVEGILLEEPIVRSNIDSIDKHINALKSLNPTPMSAEEKRYWTPIYYREYSAKHWPEMKIYEAISIRLGCSIRLVRAILSNIGSSANVQTQEQRPSSRMKLVAKIRSEYDWLTDEQTLKGLKDPMYLLSLADAHYTAIQFSKASIPDLLEVTYTKLEEAEFSKQNEETMLFWKFLAEEYQKRFGS